MRPEEGDQGIDLNVEPDACVHCSICLDLVSYDGQRSRAKLQCGHEFHLDCIGSAFNSKGMMQCPNCRKVEKGRWLYASGSTNSSPEASMDDGVADILPFYYGFAEMQPYRVHLCPFRGFTHVHPSSESSLGIVSSLAPMIAHQHPGSNPHPHGWFQYQHPPPPPPPPYQHNQQSSSLPMPPPINGTTARSLQRFVTTTGRIYDPNAAIPAFSPYPENPSLNYMHHAWGGDNVPPYP